MTETKTKDEKTRVEGIEVGRFVPLEGDVFVRHVKVPPKYGPLFLPATALETERRFGMARARGLTTLCQVVRSAFEGVEDGSYVVVEEGRGRAIGTEGYAVYGGDDVLGVVSKEET